jgi:Zinc metalloprotease (elastase)
MKKLLVVLALMLFVMTVSAEQKNLFAAASVKKIDGVTAMVSGLDIQVKTDTDSLKNFIKNDFYKAFNIGKNVEPELLRAVKIGDASIYKFVPFYKGIKVEGVYTVITMRNGKIDRINNGLSDIDIDITKMIPEKDALKSAMALRNIKTMPKNYMAEKIITRYFGKFVPAYKIRFAPATLADSRYHIVNALTGKVIKSSHSTFFADGDETDTGNTEPDPADTGDTGTPDPADTGDTEPVEQFVCDGSETDTAKIWKFNPLITPELEEVELPWVASWDDSELDEKLVGSLITEKDANGIRKIKAYNCPDDDTKVAIDPASMGIDLGGMTFNVHVCHPMALANKCEKGNFIYDDCESGHEFSKENMTPEKIDRCAEISMYYHASKIYDYIRSLYTDIDSKNEFYLQNNDKDKPLNVISNFVMPSFNDIGAIMQGNNELAPLDNAFFTQEQPMLNMLLKDFGVTGDLLVFGQGTKADLGYDGDVIYHEFGHATIYTAGIMGLEYTDKYGMTVEPGALHEGMADTFAFIMTDNTCTGEYASQGFADIGAASQMDVEVVDGKDIYCMRSALNKKRVFEDFVGEVHWDGQPFLASNWDIYQLIKGNDKDTQKHRDNLAKLFLKTLYAIGDANASYKLWAETLMAEVEKDDNFKGKAKEIKKILEDRNFFEEVRARSVNEMITDTMYIPAGGSNGGEDDPMGGLMGSGGGIEIEDGDKTINIGPAYIQYYFDVPADAPKDALKLSAKIAADASSSMLGGFGGGGTPTIKIYYRKGAPIEYVEGENAIKVEKDGEATGDSSKGWFIPDVEKGAKYYIQFVNVSASAATAAVISVESADAPKEEEVSDEDKDTPDDEMTYEDDEENQKEEGKKKKSSGCSLVL